MSYYTGSQTAAVGSLLSILAATLLLNSHWTVEDASVGTNNKTYKWSDGDSQEFYLNIDDNYVSWPIVRLWQGWDSVNHAGTGLSTPSGTMFVKQDATYKIHYNDDRFIYSNMGTNYTYSFYVGQVRRFNAAYNMPVLVATTATYSSDNPMGHGGPATTSTKFYCLDLYNMIQTNFHTMFHNNYDGCWSMGNKTYAGVYYLQEPMVVTAFNYKPFGIFDGVIPISGQVASLGIADGDTITVGGVTVWDVLGSGHLVILKRT